MGQKKRKPSWSSNGDDDAQVDSLFTNNPFLEALSEYVNSPEGELQLEADEVLYEYLLDVKVDAKKRLLLWPDAEQLTVDQSVDRIFKQYPKYAHAFIEESLLDWLLMGYAPEDYSATQMDEFDALTEQWVLDHQLGHTTPKKIKKTRHS
jgi:hypothetical protein